MKNIFTSESVAAGHPDKVADQISDTILDEIIAKDKFARVACEVFVGMGYVIIGGEINTETYIDVLQEVRKTIIEIGYDRPEYGFDGNTVAVLNSINKQSPDIARGVKKTGTKKQGAGDQGSMIGYACRETKEMMPLPIMLAHKIVERMDNLRKNKTIPYLRPDGKSQVSVIYRNNAPQRIENVVIAAQHNPDVSQEQIKKDIIKQVINPICNDFLDKKTRYYINNTGRFVVGGPVADTGMTGRKIVVDGYGIGIPVGGGAFCLAGDSFINTEKGLVKINKAQEIGAKGLLVKTDIHPVPAGGWYDNGLKTTQIVKTMDGYQLEGTLNHLVRVIDNDGNYTWKQIGELQKDDWVAIQIKNRLFGDDRIPDFNYTYRPGTAEGRKKKYVLPDKLNKDYAYLLGLLVGDGDCTDEGSIKVCICDQEMKKIVPALFKKLVGDTGRIYGHWAYLGGVEFRAFLKHLGLSYARSFEKTVPRTIFNSSREVCAAFLRGLFDTDGCVRITGRNKNTIRVHLATTSPKLAQEVQLLLLNFGIVSSFRAVQTKNYKAFIKGRQINSVRVRYDLTIKGSRSIRLFREEIGFNLFRKQKILSTPAPSKRDFCILPNQRERIIRLFRLLPIEEQKHRKDRCKIGRFTRLCQGKATKELTYEKAREFLCAYRNFLSNEPEFQQLEELVYMNHYYSRVKEKISSFAWTYDLNIPFSHTFTANGFVCHNSGKDPTKVDRSGAYMARYIAKNVVASGVCEKCLIRLSYVIGGVRPVEVCVDTQGTSKVSEAKISKAVSSIFDLSPFGIIKELDLLRPIYKKTACYGHFGRAGFSWEKTDKAGEIKKMIGNYS